MKQTTKILLLMIVVSVIGAGLPATFSLGTGQHQFVQVDPTSPDTINAFCMKCHNDAIQSELMASGNGLYNGGIRIHSTLGCQGCHQITSTVNSNGYGMGMGSIEHAARMPTCVDCHIDNAMLLPIGDAGNEIIASSEAHKGFNDDTACIACHTTVSITGSFSATYSQFQVRSGLIIGD